jgi:prolyl-tRNA synthetase
VMRWEMRTRMFLRTSEFLWQEGHTAHANAEEARQETLTMLNVYARFAEDVLAMPVIQGEKSAGERFPGAENTYCIEAMMQDKKALQAGTSHYLGQNFARAFNIKFLNREGVEELAYTTSWGVSTRLIGGLIMTHSDDDGLRLPPRLASTHLVILPVIHKPEQREAVLSYCEKIAAACRTVVWPHGTISAEIDQRELTGGEKAWSWVKKGVPLRVEIGGREAEAGNVTVTRRDRPYKDRTTQSLQAFIDALPATLDDIQKTLFDEASAFQRKNTHIIDSKKDFYDFFNGENHGGFALTHWNGDPGVEDQIKKDLNVTIRCLPLIGSKEPGICPFSQGKSAQRVVFAKAY